MFRFDNERNERCYGPEATVHQILGGAVAPIHAMDPLMEDIRLASRAALVAAFEPSNATEADDEEE